MKRAKLRSQRDRDRWMAARRRFPWLHGAIQKAIMQAVRAALGRD